MLSIEAFVVTNFLMNLLVLSVSARSMGHVCWRRVATAAGIGTAYAVAAYAWLPALRNFAVQMLCLLVMVVVLFMRKRKGKDWIRGFFRSAGGCVFAGGIMALLEERMLAGSPLMTASGWLIVGVCAFLSDGVRQERSEDSNVRLRIKTRMGSVEIEALVDTGNRLTEPLSGLPVVVVGRKWLSGLLDESCLGRPESRLPPGFRIVRYGALGGNGEMYCFRPESVGVWRGSGWTEAPDVWVAVYPGEIPSGVEALTPPIF